MKNAIFFLVILVLFIPCCRSRKQDKAAKKEYILKEELSIGNQENANSIFSRISDIEVDYKDNIYVLEGKANEIRVFNNQGEFVRKFARPGEGPGEIRRAYEFSLDDKNEMVYILDFGGRKISKYHFNGEFIADIRMNMLNIEDIFLDPNGNLLLLYISQKENQKGHIEYYNIKKMTPEGKELGQSIELFYREVIRTDFSFYFSQPYSPMGLIRFNNYSKYFVYGITDRYEINIYDTDFKKTSTIGKPEVEKKKVSNHDKEIYIQEYLRKGEEKKRLELYKKVIAYFKFPTYFPVLSIFYQDDEGNILVRTESNDIKAHYNVYNSSGFYLKRMIISNSDEKIHINSIIRNNTIFRKGCIYTSLIDENDDLVVKKYRLIEIFRN